MVQVSLGSCDHIHWFNLILFLIVSHKPKLYNSLHSQLELHEGTSREDTTRSVFGPKTFNVVVGPLGAHVKHMIWTLIGS